jgi:hypothetical protein
MDDKKKWVNFQTLVTKDQVAIDGLREDAKIQKRDEDPQYGNYLYLCGLFMDFFCGRTGQ